MKKNKNLEDLEILKYKLKIQALTERVATLTAQYEDQVADLRVSLTLMQQENEALKAGNVQEDSEAETSDDS